MTSIEELTRLSNKRITPEDIEQMYPLAEYDQFCMKVLNPYGAALFPLHKKWVSVNHAMILDSYETVKEFLIADCPKLSEKEQIDRHSKGLYTMFLYNVISRLPNITRKDIDELIDSL